MGQAEIIVGVVQGQLLVQALFALAQGGDASADRRHMLPESEVEAFHECRVDLPATSCQHLLYGLKRPEDHTVTDAYQTPAPRRFDDLRLEQVGQGLSTICQPQFIKLFPPSARPAHDEAGSHHSTSDDAAWPRGYAAVDCQYCVRPDHDAVPSPAT